MDILTPGNITFIIGLLGVLFTVFNYFRNPQIKADKKDALLAQQVQWTIGGNERRFKEMQESFQGLLIQTNNHIHTIEEKLDGMGNKVAGLDVTIAQLGTIIEERIPRK